MIAPKNDRDNRTVADNVTIMMLLLYILNTLSFLKKECHCEVHLSKSLFKFEKPTPLFLLSRLLVILNLPRGGSDIWLVIL